MATAKRPSISVVVPCFNEAASLPELTTRIGAALANSSIDHQLIFVDDGSRDSTWTAIKTLAATNSPVRGVRLSRNFGKEIAILSGLDAADGDAVVLMDADLQHPPELITEFIARWREGHDVVYGARRDRTEHRGDRGVRWFYRTFNALADVQIADDAGDFRLMSRRVVDVILRLRERTRFTKGLFAWVGFDGVAVPYDVAPRRHGTTSFSTTKLLRFAFHGLVSFSTAPLKLGIVIGAVSAVAALALGAFYLVRTILIGIDVPGYASIIVSVLALGGLMLLQLGLVGLYVGRIYDEVKGRPPYVVRDEVGTVAPRSADVR